MRGAPFLLGNFMADENMYEDQADMAPETPEEETQDESESKTALLPKEFFGSKELEVGKECTVKIEKVFEDEVQVSYVPHGKSEDDSGKMGKGMPAKDEMASMMEDMG